MTLATSNAKAPAKTISIVPVTDASDVPTLVRIDLAALQPDPMLKWFELYLGVDEETEATKALTAAIADADQHLYKAVQQNSDTGAAEIVGFIHFLVQYIQIDKVDPFCPHDEYQQRDPVPEKSAEQQAAEARIMQALGKLTGWDNEYIKVIRGKRHVHIRTLIVDPVHQRKGIARQLVSEATRFADQNQLWSWLRSRPAAEKIYLDYGFVSKGVHDLSTDEVQLGVFHGMAREPLALGSG